MESAEAVAAKRKVLIDALMMCLGKSRVVQVVDGKTVRSVIESASGELWREGEFRLDPVWKLLVSQPGLSAEEVAPPLLVFKAYENELGVQVRIPQALSAIPRGEQIRLRDALGVQRADFAKAIDEMKSLAAQEATQDQREKLARDAASTVGAGKPASKKPAPAGAKKPAPAGAKKPERKLLAAILGIVAVLAIGGSVWFALRDTSNDYDLRDVASLQLAKGKRAGSSVTATITDGKWGSLSPADKKKAVSGVMDVEVPKGVRSVVLLDEDGKTRAMADETPDGRVIVLP
jgi:hypothetical protein